MRTFLALMLLGLFFNGAIAESQNRYPFKSVKQEQQFNDLTQELRCLVCQNETLEASSAPLANDIKHKIYQMIQAGKSNPEILDYLKARYGDFIDFNPPFSPRTYLLWLGPFILLGLGFFILFRLTRRIA